MKKNILLVCLAVLILLGVIWHPLNTYAQGEFTTYLSLIMKNWPWVSSFGVEIQNFNSIPKAVEANNEWIRYNALSWSDYQPTSSNEFIRNTTLENNLIKANQAGQKVILIVRDTPTWARKYLGSICGPIRQNKLEDFAKFMKKLVEEYSKPPYNVRYFELWNEPDAPIDVISSSRVYGCWGDPSLSYYGGGYYAEMLKVVYPVMKAANPQAQVVLGGLLLDCDPREPVKPNPGYACDSLDKKKMGTFFEGILANKGGDFFDILSFHGYAGYARGTSPIVREQTAYSNWAAAGGWVEGKLDFLREIMQKYTVRKPIILSEAGLLYYNDQPTTDYQEDKAEYLVWLYTRNWAKDIMATTWYTLDNGGWRGSGLLDATNTPTKAYWAYKTMTQTLQYAKFVIEIDQPDNIKIFEFIKGYKVWVLFSMDGQPKTQSNLVNVVKSYDLYGNPIDIIGGQITFDQPIYIEFSN